MWLLTSSTQGQTSCSHLTFKEPQNTMAMKMKMKCPSQREEKKNCYGEVHFKCRGTGMANTKHITDTLRIVTVT